MLSNEERFIIKCVSDMINGVTTQEPDYEIDMDRVKKISDSQSISELIYYQCRKWIGSTASYREFKRAVINEAYISQNRAYLLRQISEECSKYDIDLIVMKGSVFRNYYPVPELRNMGDVDLVIKEKDIQKVDDIMLNLGFSKYVDNHSVWTYSLNRFEFEIHNQMFYESLTNDIDYIEYFSHVWNHTEHRNVFSLDCDNLYVPDDEFHFLYLIAHTAKHIANKGTGFRPFIDMVLMARKCQLDMDHIKEELVRLKLYDFCQVCFSLCEYWFDVDMPFKGKSSDEEFNEYVTRKIFRDGIFGIDNEENTIGSLSKEIKKSGSNYTTASLRIMIGRIFPPYQDMQLIESYRFVDGRPYLMPVAWIYRWFYCLIRKPFHSIELIMRPYIKKEEIKTRESLLNRWGL